MLTPKTAVVLRYDYPADLFTSLLLAAVRVRDAAACNDAEELGQAIIRLTDVVEGIGRKMTVERVA